MIIADAQEGVSTDDATVFAEIKPSGDQLSVRVTLAPSTNAPVLIDEAAAKALLGVLNDEASGKFPGWPVVITGL